MQSSTARVRLAARSRAGIGLTTAAALAACLGPLAAMAGAHGGAAPAGAAASPSLAHGAAHAEAARAERAYVRTAAGRAELRQRRRWRSRDHVRPLPGRARAAVAGPAGEIGSWSEDARFDLPIPAIHSVVLVTGKVLFWGERFQRENTVDAYVYDPATGSTKRVDPPIDPATGNPANIFCAGQSLLADGRVLVTGGNLAYSTETEGSKGLRKVFTFNPYDESWTAQPDMRQGRWYPTQVLQPNGDTIIQGGADDGGLGRTNRDIEVFTPSPHLNGRGTVKLVSSGTGTAPPSGGLYPHMFLMPSGRTLTAGPGTSTSWLFDGMTGDATFGWTDARNQARCSSPTSIA
jgi:hypothetical protein